MNSRGWRIAAASAIGTSHVRQGVVCQDRHACNVHREVGGKTVAILVASDGAGSAQRAHEGSEIACSVFLEQVDDFLAVGNAVGDIGADLARSWVTAIRSIISVRAEEFGATIRDYACTLLAAVVSEEAAAFIQIGDGAMVVADEAGEWAWVHWPQRGDYANSTFFITDERAAEQMAFDLVRGSIDEIAVFTDGIESLVLHYATKTVHAPFFEKMFAPVRALETEGLDDTLSAGLERYLASPTVCERTDDDKTLILATRRKRSPTVEKAAEQ
ncbi:PP2C family serine/threonine-protein phosphatase [Methylosinus sp. Ce-a6]|uniref:PP2C family serine/threonine-protein phosphatase n=1 Tax=Methylosinus sp. Ce-a6 TaxID=2172005 RepID=UPI00135AABD1|nr:PP2C family serine/threonine-protein phosphatase [Methylosinus sp. Ce-a6]